MQKLLIIVSVQIGVRNSLSPAYCENWHETEKNIIALENNSEFDGVFIINTEFKEDSNIHNFIPKHFSPKSGDHYFNTSLKYKLKNKKVEVFTKDLGLSNHQKEIIGKEPSQITLVGHCLSWHIVPLFIDLMKISKEIIVHKNCVDDFSQESKDNSIRYLFNIGAKIKED